MIINDNNFISRKEDADKYAEYILANSIKIQLKIRDGFEFEIGQAIIVEDNQSFSMSGEYIVYEVDKVNQMIKATKK